jgi:hypothetical protein
MQGALSVPLNVEYAHPDRDAASGPRSESSVSSGRVERNGTNSECNRHVASAARPAKALKPACGGRKTYAERDPALVQAAKALSAQRPRLSPRKIADALAANNVTRSFRADLNRQCAFGGCNGLEASK